MAACYRRLLHTTLALLLVALLVLNSPGVMPGFAQSYSGVLPAEWQADSAFNSIWSRVDGPVAAKSVPRSWLWGPLPLAVANETYAESATSKRLVEYFDKGRMEINDPAADRTSPWFVTSGLLVYEMATGTVQTGNQTFETRQPSTLPVAGDAGSPDAPGYAAFAAQLGPVAESTGKPAAQRIDRTGALSPYTSPVDQALVTASLYDQVSRHNVPKVFADWLNQTGLVLQGSRLVQGRIVDPLFVLGRPITEAFWVNTLIAGKPASVLVQLFERRALTYNPANEPEWRVEMANVGRSYFDWRYNQSSPAPAVSAEVGANGVAVHGWNWSASAIVTVSILPQSGGATLTETATAYADAQGRFTTAIPVTQSLQDALRSGAKIELAAQSGAAKTALPLAGKPEVGAVHLEGSISLAEATAAGSRLLLTTLQGKQWRVVLPLGTPIAFSDGGPASPSALQAGIAAIVDGTIANGTVTGGSIKLVSVSRTAARINYSWTKDNGNITVAGTGWPAMRDVSFGLGPQQEAATPFATLKSDSRGNLLGTMKLPAQSAGGQGAWLYARSAGSNGDPPVQIAVPFDSLGSPSAPSPNLLYITGKLGTEQGAIGSYCTVGSCFPSAGAQLPLDALTTAGGDVLGLRAQSGIDTLLSPDAESMSARLYGYPDSTPFQADSGPYFAPAGEPLYTWRDTHARPFSVALPAGLAAGRYALVLSIEWPDTSGKNNGTYYFAIRVP